MEKTEEEVKVGNSMHVRTGKCFIGYCILQTFQYIVFRYINRFILNIPTKIVGHP